MEFVINRAYGKPRQHLVVSDPNDRPVSQNPVRITMPDNGRQPRAIDIEHSDA
jgi:hypothetical protein